MLYDIMEVSISQLGYVSTARTTGAARLKLTLLSVTLSYLLS